MQTALIDLQPSHKFLVIVDSDGCVFDSMEIKHRKCFIPNFIKYFDLDAVSKYASETAEFVNLYSKWRGANRFISYTVVLELLSQRPEMISQKINILKMLGLRDWLKKETKLGHPTLNAEFLKSGDPDLKRALEWSISVNECVKKILYDIPPFANARHSLEKISKWADIIVCSVTQDEELVREWQEHQLAQYVRFIGGQQVGNKVEIMAMANADGKYKKENVIMLGDAPGDKHAAQRNDILFFPIKPNQEEKSWDLFYNEASERFKSGCYVGEYQSTLIAEFDALLPEIPPWV